MFLYGFVGGRGGQEEELAIGFLFNKLWNFHRYTG